MGAKKGDNKKEIIDKKRFKNKVTTAFLVKKYKDIQLIQGKPLIIQK